MRFLSIIALRSQNSFRAVLVAGESRLVVASQTRIVMNKET